MNKIEIQVKNAIEALWQRGGLEKGDLVIIGCSTSEVMGGVIGKQSAPEVGIVIAKAAIEAGKQLELEIGFQCCEHLNRALCIEKKVLKAQKYTQVAAIPMPKAGGSVPAAAWDLFENPCLVTEVTAQGVIDIGDTLVGMHIQPVAVPVRMEEPYVGKARVVMAFARPPYIGGQRAVYDK